MISYKKSLLMLCAALVLPLSALAADPYPVKQVKFTVGYAPGGGTDVIARLLASELTGKWSQQVVVENKTGAGGMIAAQQVVNSSPDGHALLIAYTPEVSLNKLVYKQMQYDPLTDLQPIALATSAPLYLVAGPKSKVTTYAQLVELKKTNASISYGSPGIGGQQHLAGELLKIQTGMNLIHVPYRGTSQAVADLLGGQIDLLFATAPSIIGHIRAGTLKPLLVTSNSRDAMLPDVMSAREAGLKDFEISNWFGMFGPKGMNAQLVEKISADVATVLADKGVAKKLSDQGLSVTYMAPERLRAYVNSEMKKYGDIIDKVGLQKQ
ncbi:tripartite tricarboxylate transporter substrate binding protein [Lacisediminimonas sp.]|uniref:Bug family tripartite tricarboxylate transporter substrate binding protein n=1 Tax=Lacisediminimonas sp. TaxID=3060582 RepID=UPI002718E4B8|nr:tripartite tricarboxylate transporter substrate binding protein [Lacisediminimonas sp.]MDO8300078.1 tripartite tricarboxylate transporter substrate binding protein [Lacisediminimonas sp.]